ncbi:MAG: 2Fe-2S iron-sulfur cluster binding domain-containing protein [Deltaproteobacteria bacterium]|mgnify:CR=1 FL=1|jgi:glycine betaine catabolism B|nr:2Fe-2S iron-sulfur cluster binding domain-containing protein [Deltaproteobacteria bacterium]
MKKAVFEDFDGYDDIIGEIEYSRKFGVDYTQERSMPERFINRLHPPRLRLRLGEIIEETASAKTFRLVSEENELPPFLAGQYISLLVETGGILTNRPYSISSPPNQAGFWDITVRRVPSGLVSNFLLDHVKKGEILHSSGPCGNFYHNPLFHDKSIVLIAGGAGITPFMSMIREIAECGLDRHVHLFFGSKTLEEALFHHELTSLSARFENIQYLPVIEKPSEDYPGTVGLITGKLIQEKLGDLSGKTFYLCGPQGLYDFCIPELEELGIPGRKIRKEVYGAPLEVSACPGWPREIHANQAFSIAVKEKGTISARAGEPVIKSLEKAGLTLKALCRSGECSMCRVRVVSGRVFQPKGVPVRKSDTQFGYVHACVSYPLGDLEIEI